MKQPKDTPEKNIPAMNQDDEYTAAALDRMMDEAAPLPPLPAALAARVIADGEEMVAGFAAPQTADVPYREPARSAGGLWQWLRNPLPAWGAAFASLLLAFAVMLGPSPASTPSPAELDATLAQNADAIQLNWQGMGDPDFAEVAGYVRWDNSTQRGVMRLSGLPVNDPTQRQYQLWIVDPLRDSNPIDGGVFNISEGDNLVAIDAKLEVIRPKAFAVTLEQPGGVVVSEGPLLVIASS